MSKRVDDTPEQEEPSRAERKPKSGSYYYDDATGYEVYDPSQDDEDEDEMEDDPTVER